MGSSASKHLMSLRLWIWNKYWESVKFWRSRVVPFVNGILYIEKSHLTSHFSSKYSKAYLVIILIIIYRTLQRSRSHDWQTNQPNRDPWNRFLIRIVGWSFCLAYFGGQIKLWEWVHCFVVERILSFKKFSEVNETNAVT